MIQIDNFVSIFSSNSKNDKNAQHQRSSMQETHEKG